MTEETGLVRQHLEQKARASTTGSKRGGDTAVEEEEEEWKEGELACPASRKGRKRVSE